jgi:hypothetical protein
MQKIFSLVICSALLFTIPPDARSQKNVLPNEKSKIAADDDSDFYSAELLAADLKQSDVVAHVNVLSYQLIDQIGQGGCELNEGVGYCLYRLKAQVQEIFKGKIKRKTFEFYKVTDADYAYKKKMLGRHVVFLGWSSNYPDKKMSLGTMENSTRDIKHNILRKLRKIARKRN